MESMIKYLAVFCCLFGVAVCRDCVCATGTNLNVRSGPSTSSTVIAKITRNTCLEFLSTSGGWDEVFFNGDVRIHCFYLCSLSNITFI